MYLYQIFRLSLQGNQFDIKIEGLPYSEFNSGRESAQSKISIEINIRMKGQISGVFQVTTRFLIKNSAVFLYEIVIIVKKLLKSGTM